MTISTKIARILTWLGFLVGAIAVGLQFTLTMQASMANGRGLGLSLLFFFTFFTILSNIASVLCHAAQILPFKALDFFRSRQTAGAIATAMAVVGLVYHFILSVQWAPQGLFLLCDRLLHYVTPVLMMSWWLVSATGETTWKRTPVWLVYPLLYLGLVYIRWAFIREVPYPFLDPGQGATKLALSIAGICAVFVLMALLLVSADKGAAQFKAGQRAVA